MTPSSNIPDMGASSRTVKDKCSMMLAVSLGTILLIVATVTLLPFSKIGRLYKGAFSLVKKSASSKRCVPQSLGKLTDCTDWDNRKPLSGTVDENNHPFSDTVNENKRPLLSDEGRPYSLHQDGHLSFMSEGLSSRLKQLEYNNPPLDRRYELGPEDKRRLRQHRNLPYYHGKRSSKGSTRGRYYSKGKGGTYPLYPSKGGYPSKGTGYYYWGYYGKGGQKIGNRGILPHGGLFFPVDGDDDDDDTNITPQPTNITPQPVATPAPVTSMPTLRPTTAMPSPGPVLFRSSASGAICISSVLCKLLTNDTDPMTCENRLHSVDPTTPQGFCLKEGNPRFSLAWSGTGDYDLHVILPSGVEISPSNRYDETSGARMTLAVNPGGLNGSWSENIVLPLESGGPRGIYTVYVKQGSPGLGDEPYYILIHDDVNNITALGPRKQNLDTHGEGIRFLVPVPLMPATAMPFPGPGPVFLESSASGATCNSSDFCNAITNDTDPMTCERQFECFDPVGDIMLQGYCLKQGNPRFSLVWSGNENYDLHLILPSGVEISPSNRYDETSGARMTLTVNPGGLNGFWSENIVLPLERAGPGGNYTVYVKQGTPGPGNEPYGILVYDDVTDNPVSVSGERGLGTNGEGTRFLVPWLVG